VRRSDGPLAEPRDRLIDAVAELVAGDAERAARALLLPPAVAAQALAVNAALRRSPTTPALRRYAGVVYDGLSYGTLSAPAQRLARRSVLVFSGLFGVVRGDEPVPPYRVPAKAAVPGVGIVGTYWRPRLEEALPSLLGHGLIIDLRSGDYAAMWRPRGDSASRVVTVRVLSPTPSGAHAVVSYPSKFAKGVLTAALLERAAGGYDVTSVDDVAAAWRDCGGAGARVQSATRVDILTG
jgi:hypothetical protein